MRISHTAPLPAGVEDVFAIISTTEYQQAKIGAGPEGRASVTEQVGGLTAVHTERVLPTRGMPGPVTSMVGDTLQITEQQTWRPPAADGSRTADLEITVGGVPVTLRGHIVLAAAAVGSTMTVDGDLRCSIPLLGRKVEEAAMTPVQQSMDTEVRLLTERLT